MFLFTHSASNSKLHGLLSLSFSSSCWRELNFCLVSDHRNTFVEHSLLYTTENFEDNLTSHILDLPFMYPSETHMCCKQHDSHSFAVCPTRSNLLFAIRQLFATVEKSALFVYYFTSTTVGARIKSPVRRWFLRMHQKLPKLTRLGVEPGSLRRVCWQSGSRNHREKCIVKKMLLLLYGFN